MCLARAPGKNVSLTIHLKDNVGNVTLGFSVVYKTYTYYGDVAMGVLDTIEFNYNPGSIYFPNHGIIYTRDAYQI